METVHPRVCGEHSRAVLLEGTGSGSSPRMRGTPVRACASASCGRFIPAYAGNTNENTAPPTLTAVHPRVCGEHFEGESHQRQALGSSPRMRGTLFIPDVIACKLRFIPAYAGNTFFNFTKLGVNSVHPRVCGEHITGIGKRPDEGGSSPRMRGTRSRERQSPFPRRFIPAYAGNTQGQRISSAAASVHPRVCGEHYNDLQNPWTGVGSSPRMRGTQRPSVRRSVSGRFIPAYAGNTPTNPLQCWQLSVHPRVCGEHFPRCPLGRTQFGSSPRMRGTPRRNLSCCAMRRFIPAYAGNTSE